MNGICRLFVTICNMSVTAGFVILLVLAGRCLLLKAPRSFPYFLWIIVGFRLVCPYTFSSQVSIFNLDIFSGHVTGNHALWTGQEELSKIPFYNEAAVEEDTAQRNIIEETDMTDDRNVVMQPDSKDREEIGEGGKPEEAAGIGESSVLQYLTAVWILGIAVLLVHQILAGQRLRRHVSFAVQLEENIFQCENISVPFVMGFLRPRIYLPLGISEIERNYILLHEQYHLRRHDHQVKVLSIALLAVYWFHPLVWLAYHLMCKDMEMSCDEKVIQTLGREAKKGYSSVLLKFAAREVRKEYWGVGLLAFGDTSVKRRIRNILDFKNPRKQAVVLGTAVCILIILIGLGNGLDRDPQIRCVKQLGKGDIEYEYKLSREMKSFLIYKEYYQNGELKEYRVIGAEDLADADARQDGKITLRVERNSQKMGQGWELAFLNKFEGEKKFLRDLNTWESLNYGYLGMMENYFLENQTDWRQVEEGQGITLAAWHLCGVGKEEIRRVPCQEFMDEQTKMEAVGQNAGEILYYLVFSEKSADELSEEYAVSPYVRNLIKAANPYLGDAPADKRLLDTIGFFPDMEQTLELETTKEPYVMKMHFESQPEEEIFFHKQAVKSAILLLCLIENVDRIEWTYSVDLAEGPTERHFFCDREEAARLCGVEDIRRFADSKEAMQELVIDKLPCIYQENVMNVIGLGVDEDKFASPDGKSYQNFFYFIGRLPGEEYDGVFQVLTNEEEITARDIAEAAAKGGTSKKLHLVQNGIQ